MDERKIGREIQASIRRVLLAEWDPIGMKDVASDEYDAYIGPVYRLLVSGAPAIDIAEYLNSVEREQMGLAGAPPEALLGAAEALRRLPVRMASPEGKN